MIHSKLSISTAFSEIIDSRTKLIESPKILAISAHEVPMLAMAPEGSFLGKLSKKSTFVVRAVISREEIDEFFHKKGITAYVIFAKHIALAYTLGSLAPFASLNNMIAFYMPSSYHEEPEAVYLRRSLDADRKRFIHRV